MMTETFSLVGYRPEEAEAEAAARGLTIVWVEALPPKWLPPQHAPRVARQRRLADGRLELLRALVPTVGVRPPAASADTSMDLPTDSSEKG